MRPRAQSFVRECAVVSSYAVGAAAALWPLALYLGTHLPLGTEASATVPLFNLWTLEWNRDRLLSGYAGFWDAGFFHPMRGATALSEPYLPAGWLFSTLRALGFDGLSAYGLQIHLYFVLNACAARRLARVLGAPPAAAWLGGMLALWLPFVTVELGVLQLVAMFPVLFATSHLLEWSENPRYGAAVGFGAWSAFALLFCGYHGVFWFVALLFAAPCLLSRRIFEAQALRSAAVGAAVGAALLAPVLPEQLEWAGRFERPLADIAAGSARPSDFARLPPGAIGLLLDAGDPARGRSLSPGLLLPLLAGFGALEAWRRGRRRWVLFLWVASLALLGLSFGPTGPVHPFLRELVPGLAQLRSPFRAAGFAQMFLLALAPLGLWRISRWPTPWGRSAMVAAIALLWVEVAVVPTRLAPIDAERWRASWVPWLAAQAPGAVAHLPFPQTGRAAAYGPAVESMLAALEHRHPLIGGYSGFFPPHYNRSELALRGFPSGELESDRRGVALLLAAGTRWMVLDRRAVAGAGFAELSLAAGVREVYRDDFAIVYAPAR